MKVQFYAKESWGNVRYYIVGETIRQAIKSLTGKETVDFGDLLSLKALGLEVEQVPNPDLRVGV